MDHGWRLCSSSLPRYVPLQYGRASCKSTSLGEFKKAYPEAKVIGVDGLGAKKKSEGLTLDGGTGHLAQDCSCTEPSVFAHPEYGKDPADTRYGFEDEVRLSPIW